jgi:hypothetical protein
MLSALKMVGHSSIIEVQSPNTSSHPSFSIPPRRPTSRATGFGCSITDGQPRSVSRHLSDAGSSARRICDSEARNKSIEKVSSPRTVFCN